MTNKFNAEIISDNGIINKSEKRKQWRNFIKECIEWVISIISGTLVLYGFKSIETAAFIGFIVKILTNRIFDYLNMKYNILRIDIDGDYRFRNRKV